MKTFVQKSFSPALQREFEFKTPEMQRGGMNFIVSNEVVMTENALIFHASILSRKFVLTFAAIDTLFTLLSSQYVVSAMSNLCVPRVFTFVLHQNMKLLKLLFCCNYISIAVILRPTSTICTYVTQ